MLTAVVTFYAQYFQSPSGHILQQLLIYNYLICQGISTLVQQMLILPNLYSFFAHNDLMKRNNLGLFISVELQLLHFLFIVIRIV